MMKMLNANQASTISCKAKAEMVAERIILNPVERVQYWWFKRRATLAIHRSANIGINRAVVPTLNLKLKHLLAKELRALGYKVQFSDWTAEFLVRW